MREKYGLIGLLLTFGSQTIVGSISFPSGTTYSHTHGTDTVQRGFETDPDSLASSSSTFPLLHLASESRLRSSIAGQNAESTMLVASLREVIRKQAQQIETLEKRLKEPSVGGKEVNAVHIFSFFAVPDLGHPSRLSYNHK
jgi:hypothetical protein